MWEWRSRCYQRNGWQKWNLNKWCSFQRFKFGEWWFFGGWGRNHKFIRPSNWSTWTPERSFESGIELSLSGSSKEQIFKELESVVRLSPCIQFGIVFFSGDLGPRWWIWVIVNVVPVSIIYCSVIRKGQEERFSGEIVSLENGCCSTILPGVLEFLIGYRALVIEKPTDVLAVHLVDLSRQFGTQCVFVGRWADPTADLLLVLRSQIAADFHQTDFFTRKRQPVRHFIFSGLSLRKLKGDSNLFAVSWNDAGDIGLV